MLKAGAGDIHGSPREDVVAVRGDTRGDRGPFRHDPFDLDLEIGGKLRHRLDVIARIAVGGGVTKGHRVEIAGRADPKLAVTEHAGQPRPFGLGMCLLAAGQHQSAGSQCGGNENLASVHACHSLLSSSLFEVLSCAAHLCQRPG
jgi:hypothetical protein